MGGKLFHGIQWCIALGNDEKGRAKSSLSLHELAYYLGASNKQNFNVFFFCLLSTYACTMDQLVMET